jgi:hypothetical protein
MPLFVELMVSLIENYVIFTSETLQSQSLPMSLTIRYFHNNLEKETL